MSDKKNPEVVEITEVEETKEKLYKRLWEKKPVKYAAAAIAGAASVVVLGALASHGSDDTPSNDEVADTPEPSED